ncbi:MAG: hypothetical protein APF76_04060 [Desulfitibacter sp. BRH_c19]|nr:MAG: hypothetical protein APF76_04060 [Desulfitibacter sp. BRH_c19]
MKKYSGLQFKKFDLHVHTPGSHDFQDKTVTAEQIVKKALEKGLRGIAITDHNTGEWVDKVKEADKGKNLTIFPGVEIYCTGGKAGIHVIAILSPDKGTKHIQGLLATLKINPDDFGTPKAVTPFAPYQVIDAISSEPYNGLAVLAHCTSSKGVLHDITGETRTKIFEHKGLLAVETSLNDFINPEKKKKSIRAIDLLNGKDPNYNCRKLGVYIVSDSKKGDEDKHSLDGIGAKFSYFKVDDEVDLESLRQCFIDREVRIRQQFEFQQLIYPYIKSVKVKGGFFDGQEAMFHPGLNSILGAKGAGKSLLVELMRFVLGQVSSQKDIFEDHNRKLQRKLDTYGSVEVRVLDETGVEHYIERTYNPTKGNPYAEEEHERIASSFPILFLSQNEIVKIAEDEQEQIRFIDRFFDFKHFQNRIKNMELDLSELDTQFAGGLKSYNILADIRKQLLTNRTELEKLNKLLSDPIYDQYKLLEEKDRVLKWQQTSLENLHNEIKAEINVIKKMEFPHIEDPLSKDPVIKRNQDTINLVRNETDELMNSVSEEIEKSLNKIEVEYKKWSLIFNEEKKKYEEHVRKAGGDRKGIELQRLRVIKQIDDLVKRETSLIEKANKLKNIKTQRDSKMKDLFKVFEEYSQERKTKCKKFERESGGCLQIKIHESTNVDEFKNKLYVLKKGSYLRDSEIDDICSRITPYEFILTLLRYEVKKDITQLTELSKKTGVEIQKLQALCEFLLSQVEYEELLQLQYRSHPQDRPEIKFRVNDEKYELIRDISVGQKCTAMLIMALSDGKFPIVIDQPEDSLDVRSVWNDMCVKIRKRKDNRQFIFTTHNSCLAVASDTDKFTIIESDATRGSIVMSGALETQEVKEEVIKYLEGGRPTFQAKSSKYGI